MPSQQHGDKDILESIKKVYASVESLHNLFIASIGEFKESSEVLPVHPLPESFITCKTHLIYSIWLINHCSFLRKPLSWFVESSFWDEHFLTSLEAVHKPSQMILCCLPRFLFLFLNKEFLLSLTILRFQRLA